MKQKLELVVGARTEIIHLKVTCELCQYEGFLSVQPEDLRQMPNIGWSKALEWEHTCLPSVEAWLEGDKSSFR